MMDKTDPTTSFEVSDRTFDHVPRPYITKHWGILNPFGDIWTNNVFATPEAAVAHLKKGGFHDDVVAGFGIIPVTVTVQAECKSGEVVIPVATPPEQKAAA